MDPPDILAHETPPFDEVSPNSFANQTFSPILQPQPQQSPQLLPSFSLEPPSGSTVSDLELRLTLDQIKHKISTLEDRLIHKERDMSFDSFAMDLRSLHTRINDIEHRFTKSPDHVQRNEMSKFIGETVNSKFNQQKRSWKLDILRKAGSIRVDTNHQKDFMNEAVLEIQRSVVGLDQNQDSLSTVLMDIIFAVCRSMDSHVRQKLDTKQFDQRLEEMQDELSRKMSDMLKFLASKHIQDEFIEIKSSMERKIQFFDDRLERVEEKTATALTEMDKKESQRPTVVRETVIVQKDDSSKQSKEQSVDNYQEKKPVETMQKPLRKEQESSFDKQYRLFESNYKQLEKKLKDLELDFTQRFEMLKNQVHHLSDRVDRTPIHSPQALNTGHSPQILNQGHTVHSPQALNTGHSPQILNTGNTVHSPQTLNQGHHQTLKHAHAAQPTPGQTSSQTQIAQNNIEQSISTPVPSLEDFVKKKDFAKLKKELLNKVDCSVLEELLRHVATREELKSMIIKSMKEQRSTHLNDVQDRLSKIETKVKDSIDALNRTPLSSTQKPNLTEAFKIQFPIDSSDEGSLVNTIYSQLTREFDEKLFMICTEVSSCKADIHRFLNQPFTRCGQWLWKCGSLRHGSAVPWNIETVNTDPDNLKWEPDTCQIKIREAGLYELSFSFFTKIRPSIQVVVNGDSVLSAINSPSYVVHHSSGFVPTNDGKLQPGTISGLSLLDFMAIPSKSWISIHFHGGKKGYHGHAFLGIRRLS